MATTQGNRKILDLKRWEWAAPAPAATTTGAFVASSRHYRQQQLYVSANTVAHLYNPNEDGWVQVPSPGLTGTFGAGAAVSIGCGAVARSGFVYRWIVADGYGRQGCQSLPAA